VNELSLALFVISTCGSPGPNNFMIMSSGVTYGVRRSVPHVVGINVGFPFMVLAVGIGMGAVLTSTPVLYDVLRPVGLAYLLYLAYRIATASVDVDDPEAGSPLSVLQAALFQWVNPKAWVMAVGAIVTYTTVAGSYVQEVVVIALIFMILGTPCTSAWLGLGVVFKRVLRSPAQLRAFNVAMALLLVVSVIPIMEEVRESALG